MKQPEEIGPAAGSARKILILAGEASGDLQGANLAGALLRRAPGLRILGVGGPRMREAGVTIFQDSTCHGFVGMWEAIVRLPLFLYLYYRTRQWIRTERPDHVILIDSPGVNMRMARYLRELGIPTTYYFPPSAWSPRLERARRIADAVDHVVATFAFTAGVYRRAEREIAYFGHPLVDMPSPGAPAEIRARLGLHAETRYVGLLPGSRRTEIGLLTPLLLDAAVLLSRRVPDVHFLIPVAVPGLMGMVRRAVARYAELPITVLDGHGTEVMALSEVLVMSSGSASLEAAILGTPMLLAYKLRRFDWWLAPFLIRDFTFMGLPNLILRQPVVPEFLQDAATPERLAEAAAALLTDATRRQIMKDNLQRVKNELGPPGVADRVAEYIVETALNGPGRRHHHQ